MIRASIPAGNEKGIALILVLWVLTIMVMIAFSFSYAARTATFGELAFSRQVEGKFLAEGGVEKSIVELFYRRASLNAPDRGEWKADGTTYVFDAGSGSCTVRIFDESGKVDINTAPEVILTALFRNYGLDEFFASSLVDSIMDWKDSDDLHRLHGAESDYYLSLPRPYRAKDANFDTVEELALIKGMTQEILYGDGTRPGITAYLTVRSGAKTININAASHEVLLAVPGITPEIADTVIRTRTDRAITDMYTVLGPSHTLANTYLSTAESPVYTIESTGRASKDSAGYTVLATVKVEGTSSHSYLYYKSPADIRHD